MVLAAQTPVNAYVGNGAANTFAFTFPVFDPTHLLVVVIDPSGNATTLTLNTDYAVTGLNAAGDPASVGSIVLVNNGQAWLTGANLTSLWTLSIVLNIPLAQTFSFRNQGDFYRTSLENALDYEMMACQQIQSGGFLITDIAQPTHTYRLVMVNGVLSQVQVT